MKKNQIFATGIAFVLALFFIACKHDNPNYQQDAKADAATLHQSIKKLTDVITFNIFPPNTASRIYAYSTIAAYEAMVPGFSEYNSFAGKLNGLKNTPQPEAGKTYCFPIASAKAFLAVGKKLTFSDEDMDAYTKQVMAKYAKMGIPDEVLQRSIAYGDAIAAHILAWADKDNYKETRAAPKYSIKKDPATWQPTPPAYMDAAEPHWNEIRTWVMDSAAQFMPPRPTAFSITPKSQFYKEALEVRDVVKEADPKKLDIAQYWDDNGFAVQQSGHVMASIKKITPGGHWMNIARFAAIQAKSDFPKSAEMYAKTAIAIADAFISCWDEKYRSNLIRPETYITQYIDKEWVPYLQTPPFPEYTSGHSVISAAAATILTDFYGNNFNFTDSTEIEFGIGHRSFESFRAASDEACISRLYGGIHYRPAIDNGRTQGIKVGEWILNQVKTKK